jgi:mitogen-activated protein kinase organizer 1
MHSAQFFDSKKLPTLQENV